MVTLQSFVPHFSLFSGPWAHMHIDLVCIPSHWVQSLNRMVSHVESSHFKPGPGPYVLTYSLPLPTELKIPWREALLFSALIPKPTTTPGREQVLGKCHQVADWNTSTPFPLLLSHMALPRTPCSLSPAIALDINTHWDTRFLSIFDSKPLRTFLIRN